MSGVAGPGQGDWIAGGEVTQADLDAMERREVARTTGIHLREAAAGFRQMGVMTPIVSEALAHLTQALATTEQSQWPPDLETK